MNGTTPYQTGTVGFRERWIAYVHTLQSHICHALEQVDGKEIFRQDEWERAGGGGGGKTRTLANGNIFEKASVNTSVVFGKVTDTMRKQLKMGRNIGIDWMDHQRQSAGKPFITFHTHLLLYSEK